MDINNIPKTRINNVEQQNVSQETKAKDTEFQAEKGRDLLGVQGDSRHVIVNLETPSNNTVQLEADGIKSEKVSEEKVVEEETSTEAEIIKDAYINKQEQNNTTPKKIGIIEKSRVKLDFFRKIALNPNIKLSDKLSLLKNIKTNDQKQMVIDILKNPEYCSKDQFISSLNTVLLKNITDLKVIDSVMQLGLDCESYSKLEEKIGTKKVGKLSDKINELKEKYGESNFSISDLAGDNNHIRVKGQDGYIYKFNVETLNLDSIANSYAHSAENLNTGTEVRVRDKSPNDVSFFDARTNMEVYINRKTGETIDKYDKQELEGEYEIWRIEPGGHKHLIGLAEISPNGTKHIEKTLTSLDGTKTNTVYTEDKDGNKFYVYQIKSADGEILLETTKKRKVISENHYLTEEDGQAYDIEIKNDKIVTTKLDENGNKTKEKVIYSIADISKKDAKKINSFAKSIHQMANGKTLHQVRKMYAERIFGRNTVSRELLPVLSNLTGSEWVSLNKTTSIILPWKEDANACSMTGIIGLGKNFNSNLFVLEHELGHEKAKTFNLCGNKEVMTIYEKEKELFTSSFPDNAIDLIDYFLEVPDKVSGMPRNLDETIAETNAILNTHQSWGKIQDRTILFQQYFPKTIAKIAELLKSKQT